MLLFCENIETLKKNIAKEIMHVENQELSEIPKVRLEKSWKLIES